MNIWLAVFIGGGAGSVARFGITRLFLALDVRSAFPYATLVTNVLATALLAFLLLRWQHHLADRDTLKALLAVGFCGGFSTFSTFSYENFLLMRQGLFIEFGLNVMISVVVGIMLFYLLAERT